MKVIDEQLQILAGLYTAFNGDGTTLGDGTKYYIEAYENDVTHIINAKI